MSDRLSNDQNDQNDETRTSGVGGDTIAGVDREVLIQLAELQARGLCDPSEESRLQRLFEAAAPSLQAEVIALQERIALDPLLRSSELPAESLRLRTLARVAHAVEQEGAGDAPIATIGPRQRAPKPSADAGRREQISVDAVRSIIDGISRERERLQAVRQPYWRAAAFFLLAALSVSVYFNWRYVSVSERLAGFAHSEILDSDMRAIAAQLAGFDFGRSRHLDLKRIQVTQKAHVEIFSDPESGRIAVLGVGFEVGDTLEIVVRDPEGGLPYTQQFQVTEMGFGKL